jgi:Flp pilus assembly protein protease CpaA
MSTPSRHERVRPAELLGLSAVFGLFTGLIVLLSTRELRLAGIFLCIAFIVGVVILAMLSLASKPNDAEQHEITDENGRAKGLLERDDDYPRGH